MNIVKKKLSKNFIKINRYKPSENLIHNLLGVDFDTAAILVLMEGCHDGGLLHFLERVGLV